jgi:hypothetical protein
MMNRIIAHSQIHRAGQPWKPHVGGRIPTDNLCNSSGATKWSKVNVNQQPLEAERWILHYNAQGLKPTDRKSMQHQHQNTTKKGQQIAPQQQGFNMRHRILPPPLRLYIFLTWPTCIGIGFQYAQKACSLTLAVCITFGILFAHRSVMRN